MYKVFNTISVAQIHNYRDSFLKWKKGLLLRPLLPYKTDRIFIPLQTENLTLLTYYPQSKFAYHCPTHPGEPKAPENPPHNLFGTTLSTRFIQLFSKHISPIRCNHTLFIFRQSTRLFLLATACVGLIFSTYQIDMNSSDQTFLSTGELANTPTLLMATIRFAFLRLGMHFMNMQNEMIMCDTSKKSILPEKYNVPINSEPNTNSLGPIKVSVKQIASNSPIEDRFCCSTKTIDGEEYLIASVIDGHSGWLAAEFVRNKIIHYITKALEDKQKLLEESLQTQYQALDNELEKFLVENSKNPSNGGACCLGLIIGKDMITVANTGDCMAVLGRKRGFTILNTVHNADDPKERMKIINAHPNEGDAVHCKKSRVVPKPPLSYTDHVLNLMGKLGNETIYSACYVKKALNPTRSFGDFFLKDEKYAYDKRRGKYRLSSPFSFPYITAQPEVTQFSRSKDDQFIIIASDGLWDYFEPQEATDLVKREISISTENATQKILDAVYERASQHSGLSIDELSQHPHKRRYVDDLTVMIIKLSEE